MSQITYRQNGDGSWTAVYVTASGDRIVHTNKNKAVLIKLMNSRYSKIS